ncbi:MAG: rRNA maturation RNase YbeY [Bacteroidia bacterium]|nr:rRNA maturation RNase YbeY [Bacteroidia bacterium]
MPVFIHFEDIKPLKINRKSIKHFIKIVFDKEKTIYGSINLIFCSDKYLLDLNRKYLSHNYFTDILTFNYTENKSICGDLFISIERVTENAKIYSVSFADELYRVIIHGLLHLIGYDDNNPSKKRFMKAKEDDYLSLFFAKPPAD